MSEQNANDLVEKLKILEKLSCNQELINDSLQKQLNLTQQQMDFMQRQIGALCNEMDTKQDKRKPFNVGSDICYNNASCWCKECEKF